MFTRLLYWYYLLRDLHHDFNFMASLIHKYHNHDFFFITKTIAIMSRSQLMPWMYFLWDVETEYTETEYSVYIWAWIYCVITKIIINMAMVVLLLCIEIFITMSRLNLLHCINIFIIIEYVRKCVSLWPSKIYRNVCEDPSFVSKRYYRNLSCVEITVNVFSLSSMITVIVLCVETVIIEILRQCCWK